MEASDSELMKQLADGDDLALNALMDRWGARVTSFLQRMTGNRDTAVDLAQETFVKLYEARKRYRPSGNFSTYLFSIGANLSRNHARWKARHPTVSIDGPQDVAAAIPEQAGKNLSPAEAAEEADRARAINHAFSLLPGDLRESMSLFIHEGLGYAEIASISGCSTKAVETRIYRARQFLKEQLKDLRS